MELPKVVIENFNDFLRGKEVEAKPISSEVLIERGAHVVAYKDSIAANTNIPVPREELHRAIGIEGTVTQIGLPQSEQQQILKVRKV
jgi:hypothetical protein